MNLFKIAVIGLALLAMVGQYLQEMRRLSIIKRLSGREARNYFERTRQRTEVLLFAAAGMLAAGAVVAIVYVFVLGR